MSASGLVLAQRMPSGGITSIRNTKRAISAGPALRFARHFGMSGEFWLNLQTGYDFAVHRARPRCRVAAEVDCAA